MFARVQPGPARLASHVKKRLSFALPSETRQGFLEIHSPKLLAGASEGGSEVFITDYFGQPACLAQSPQLYKQMTAACGGFERVMEVGLDWGWVALFVVFIQRYLRCPPGR